MPKEVMHRRAADNTYLHKDFHGALSAGIDYLERTFGEEAVRAFLRRFAAAYYAPLREAVRRDGLVALKAYFEELYAREGGRVHTTLEGNTLVVDVDACPAVTHMRDHGYTVARLFHETTRTVNEAICEGSGIGAELSEYDPETGRGVQRFRASTKEDRGS